MIFTKEQLILEIINVSESNDNWQAWYDFEDMYQEELYHILSDVINGAEHEHWNKLNFPRLKKIWEDYMRMGVIRDTRGMEDIKDLCLANIAKLYANTELVGHTSSDPEDRVDEFL